MANRPQRPARRRPVATKPKPVEKPPPEPEENLPAETEENLPAQPGGGFQVPGMEHYGDEQGDFVVPRMTIVQPMSEEGEPGHFRNSLDGEEFKTLEGIYFLRINKARVMFPEKYERGQDPLCRSDDDYQPDPRIEDPPAEFCRKCPNRDWGEDGSAPPCNLIHRYLGIQDGLPFWFDLRSSAIKPSKKFLSALNLQAVKRRVGMWNFRVDVSLVEMEFDSGRAYVPVFKNLRFEDNPEGEEMHGAFANVQYVIPENEEEEAAA